MTADSRRASLSMEFTSEMRRATRSLHSLSDRLVNSRLIIALSDDSVWADALLVFYEVFKRLEEYGREPGTPELDELFADDALLRTAVFEAELRKYYGCDWKHDYVRRPEVDAYLRHLEELKDERPLLLLAYVYHLYMGLLSGGQIIKTKKRLMSARSPSSFDGTDGGDSVVEFPGSNVNELKKRMKCAMNEIANRLSREQRCALINESQMVFVYNNSIIKTIKGTNRVVVRKALCALFVITFLLSIYLYFI